MGRLPGVQTFWADLSPSLELGLEQNANQSRDQLYAKAEAFLTCPSETLSDPGSRINYFLNNGSAINPRNGSADFDSIAKPPPWRHLSFRDFTDGLSNTAYMSERMRLDLKTDDRCFWKNGGTSQFGQGEERGLFLDLNEQFELKLLKKQPNYIYFSDQGLDNYFYYDHLWQPNRPIVYGLVIARYDLVIPPSSSHSSGVNLLFSDGSIRPIYDTIDHVMWLAIGSRNGGESESEK